MKRKNAGRMQLSSWDEAIEVGYNPNCDMVVLSTEPLDVYLTPAQALKVAEDILRNARLSLPSQP